MEDVNKNNNNKKINTFLNRYFGFVSFLFFLIIFLLCLWIFIIPEYYNIINEAKIFKEDTEKQKERLVGQEEKLQDYLIVFNDIDNEDIEKINKLLPDNKEKENLFLQFNNFAKKSSFIINEINIVEEKINQKKSKRVVLTEDSSTENKPLTIDEQIGKIKISFEVSGLSYRKFKRFLSLVESNLRIMDVDNINFSSQEGSASFDIVTYYKK